MQPSRPPEDVLADGVVSLRVPPAGDAGTFAGYAAGQAGTMFRPDNASPARQAPWPEPSRGMRERQVFAQGGAVPGRRQRGPLLLLLHGLNAAGDQWDGWRPLFVRQWPDRWLGLYVPSHSRHPAESRKYEA